MRLKLFIIPYVRDHEAELFIIPVREASMSLKLFIMPVREHS